MWESRLDGMLRQLVVEGTLKMTMPSGRRESYGSGLPEVAVALKNASLPRRILTNPDLAVAEGYMDQSLIIEDDNLHGLLELALRNRMRFGAGIPWMERPFEWLHRLGRMFAQFNNTSRSRRNVAHHYDLSGKLYDLFLDEDRQYSCAYFLDSSVSLEEAQRAKKAHIARKLLIEPGMTVLDIGCGWGGMALTLAKDYGARVVGVTLSEEQHALATKRVRDAGLVDWVEIRLQDYRAVPETFDRVVSVGMFEHVGAPMFREYFSKVRERLSPGGVALIHTIGRMTAPGYTSPFIAKYIFPGGYIPALSEISTAVEKEHLYVTDIEIWRLHYAETLKHWQLRFTARIDEARSLYDDRFCRMWRYYLVACEQAFRFGWQCVFQVQMAHEQEAVPLTRDYLYREAEQAELRHAAE